MVILFQKRLKTVLFLSEYVSTGNKKSQGASHTFVNFDWLIILALWDMQISSNSNIVF